MKNKKTVFYALTLFALFSFASFAFGVDQSMTKRHHHHRHYDVVIIGGGVSGTALFYTLAEFSNVGKIALLEKHSAEGMVNSKSTQNSQTLHMGDIETNYSLEKATKVQKAAYMVKNYIEMDAKEFPAKNQDSNRRLFNKTKKMVIGIGDEEVATLKKRYEDFQGLFPNDYLIGRDELAKLEPKLVEGRDPKVSMNAYVSDEGYAIDYGLLAKSFSERAVASKRREGGERPKVYLGTEVKEIKRLKSGHYKVKISDGSSFISPVVIVSAGGFGLKFAKSLGYGQEFGVLSLAGSFFFTQGKWINNKVYTVQIPGLPFAAVHADPDVHDEALTRLGPTAKGIFQLERYNSKSIWPYFQALGFKVKTVGTLLKILLEPKTLKFILTNMVYDIPSIGKVFYLSQARKLFPSLSAKDIVYAKGWGGTRPQIVNTKTGTLDLGDAQIVGDHILFNITPSPGASKCLGNAYRDIQQVVDFFGGRFYFNKERFDSLFVNAENAS